MSSIWLPPMPLSSLYYAAGLAKCYCSPPSSSVLKNAGLAYLHLVKSSARDADDVLMIPFDPLNAAPLLPWTTMVRAGGCTDAEGSRASGRKGEMKESERRRRTESEGITSVATSVSFVTGRMGAAGGWRNGAATRFLEMWSMFLEHEDARVDEQYGTIREIYERVVKRVDPREHAKTSSREL